MTQLVRRDKRFAVTNNIIDGPSRAQLIHALLSTFYQCSGVEQEKVDIDIDDYDSGALTDIVITGLDVDGDNFKFRGYGTHPMWHLKPTEVKVSGTYSTKSYKGKARVVSKEADREY